MCHGTPVAVRREHHQSGLLFLPSCRFCRQSSGLQGKRPYLLKPSYWPQVSVLTLVSCLPEFRSSHKHSEVQQMDKNVSDHDHRAFVGGEVLCRKTKRQVTGRGTLWSSASGLGCEATES